MNTFIKLDNGTYVNLAHVERVTYSESQDGGTTTVHLKSGTTESMTLYNRDSAKELHKRTIASLTRL